jgi:hypothetical protein
VRLWLRLTFHSAAAVTACSLSAEALEEARFTNQAVSKEWCLRPRPHQSLTVHLPFTLLAINPALESLAFTSASPPEPGRPWVAGPVSACRSHRMMVAAGVKWTQTGNGQVGEPPTPPTKEPRGAPPGHRGTRPTGHSALSRAHRRARGSPRGKLSVTVVSASTQVLIQLDCADGMGHRLSECPPGPVPAWPLSALICPPVGVLATRPGQSTSGSEHAPESG